MVANAMLLSLVERYREFGVLRAIGWSRRRLIALIFGEAAIIAFIGACLGVVIAFIAVWVLADLPDLAGILKPTFEAWVFGRALVTATAVTALGRAAEVAGDERDRLQRLLLDRHPGLAGFIQAPDTALVAVRVERYLLVDRFQRLRVLAADDLD